MKLITKDNMTIEMVKSMPKHYFSPVELAAIPCFTDIYMCAIHRLDMMSEFEITQVGMLATGEPELDSQISNEVCVVGITISGVVEYMKNGVYPTCVDRDHAKHMYDTIQKYLHEWSTHTTNSLNGSGPPIEDMQILERVAQKLYDQVADLVPDAHRDFNSLARMLGSLVPRIGRALQPVDDASPRRSFDEDITSATIRALERFGK